MKNTILLAISLISSMALAEPIQWTTTAGGNGHYYDFIPGNIEFGEANTLATGSKHNDISGHLTTITSAEEDAFILTTFSPNGAIFGLTDSAEEGTWVWITDETSNYRNWNGSEPNNYTGNILEGEDVAQYAPNGLWNDVQMTGTYNGNDARLGYLVEYDVIPEPSTFWLVGLIGACTLVIRRRLK